MNFKVKVSALFLLIFGAVSLGASFDGVAYAQSNTVVLSAYSIQSGACLSWDAGNYGSGQIDLQAYPPNVANAPAQSFLWVQDSSTGNWKVENISQGIYLSDINGQLDMQGADPSVADEFTIQTTSGSLVGYVLDTTTGHFVEQPSDTAGAGILTGSSPYAWTFAVGANSSPGCGRNVTPASGTTTFMPIGDSITWGLNIPATETQGGYRCPLFWDLETYFSHDIQFEGYSQAIPLPSWVSPETGCSATGWDGYGGQTIAEILNTVQNDGSVVNYQPQYITFMGGTNNVYWGTPQTTPSELTSILHYFFDNDPGVTVVVSTIPPFYPGAVDDSDPTENAQWNSEVPGVNQQIIAVVQQFQSAGDRIVLNDFYTAANANPAYYIGPDGIHPSVAGYNMLADELYGKLAPFVGGGSDPNAAKAVVAADVKTAAAVAKIATSKR